MRVPSQSRPPSGPQPRQGAGQPRDYVLHGWQPPPFYRVGPYHLEFTEQGFRCTPRPGTRAYRRMVARQAQQKQLSRETLIIGLFVAVWVIAVVFLK
jgi:hypothetical protein